MSIATGLKKRLVAKKQSAKGTKATAGSAQYFRRLKSDISLEKDTYESKEIRTDEQVVDFRHGLKKIAGSIGGELSGGTYQGFLESLLRALASAVVTTGALTDVTAAATTGASGTFTSVGAGFLTAGFKVGQVIRWTGWASPATANNSHNFLITGLTAGVMTVYGLDGNPPVAKASGDSVTAVTSKYLYIPETGHTRDYWTIEHDFSDIAQAEQYVDCVFSKASLKLPPTGMSEIDFSVVGLSVDTSTSAYFTTPTAVTSTGIFAAVNGYVSINGSSVGLLTDLSIDIDGQAAALSAVVGSNSSPDVAVDTLKVMGSMTAYFQDATLRDFFINETEVPIIIALTAANTAAADYMTIVMPRVKINSAKADDDVKGIKLSMSFVAIKKTTGGTGTNSLNTTIMIQDNNFA